MTTQQCMKEQYKIFKRVSQRPFLIFSLKTQRGGRQTADLEFGERGINRAREQGRA